MAGYEGEYEAVGVPGLEVLGEEGFPGAFFRLGRHGAVGLVGLGRLRALSGGEERLAPG